MSDNIEFADEEPVTETKIPVLAESFFTAKMFIQSAGPTWIHDNVVSKGPGARAYVGRIEGTATEAENTEKQYEGKTILGVKITGQFHAVNLLTGEFASANVLYLPVSYARQVQQALSGSGRAESVKLDVMVGCQATGKTPIAYRWTIAAYTEVKGQRSPVSLLPSTLPPGLREQLEAAGLSHLVAPEVPAGSRPTMIEAVAEPTVAHDALA
jgi:hypothetical protein